VCSLGVEDALEVLDGLLEGRCKLGLLRRWDLLAADLDIAGLQCAVLRLKELHEDIVHAGLLALSLVTLGEAGVGAVAARLAAVLIVDVLVERLEEHVEDELATLAVGRARALARL
jgi:hypothetical protein